MAKMKSVLFSIALLIFLSSVASAIENELIGNLTLYSFTASDHCDVQKGFYLSDLNNPHVANCQTLKYNSQKKSLEYRATTGHNGKLFIVGMYPVTTNTISIELGIDGDSWKSSAIIETSHSRILIYKLKNEDYQIISRYYVDGVRKDKIMIIPSDKIKEDRINIDIIKNETNITVRYDDNLSITTPFAYSSAYLPYTSLQHPIVYINPYLENSSDSTYVSIHLYSIKQSIPRYQITPYGSIDHIGFGIDGPHHVNTVINGTTYMAENGFIGTVWADVKYMGDGRIEYVKGLLDNGWELGIHCTGLRDLPLEAAFRKIDSEYKEITDIFGAAPTTFCSLQNGDNQTHACYAYDNYGMLWRNGPAGVHHLGGSVDCLAIHSWKWWETNIDAGGIYPSYTHRLDEEPAIKYSIDYSSFKKYIDGYQTHGIKVVGFEEYYQRNANQADTNIEIIEKSDERIKFNVKTNGYPVNLNLLLGKISRPNLIDETTNSTIAFKGYADRSISFEALDSHTYVCTYDENSPVVGDEPPEKRDLNVAFIIIDIIILGCIWFIIIEKYI